MRALMIALCLAASVPTVALAKKKPKTSGEVKKDKDKSPPPGDKSQNEGAQGRKNATEDAAKAADSPQFDRRP